MATKKNNDVIIYHIVNKETKVKVFSYCFEKKHLEDWQPTILLHDWCEVHGKDFRKYEIVCAGSRFLYFVKAEGVCRPVRCNSIEAAKVLIESADFKTYKVIELDNLKRTSKEIEI